MDISSNSTAEHCCICLEEDDIKSCCFKDKIRHIPCNCNMYCHKQPLLWYVTVIIFKAFAK